ncbi:MAG: hypothetical protein HEEMFOPI_00369 [Holosporales bacterium]
MINNKIFAAFALTAAFLSTGCAPKIGGSDYNMANVGEVSETFEGIILTKRVVNISGHETGAGTLAGGVAGGFLGSAVGGGKGKQLATVAGAIGGALAGHAIEQSASSQEGFEYSVKVLRTGEIITLAQGAEPNLSIGQPVYVVRSNRGNSRVTPR